MKDNKSATDQGIDGESSPCGHSRPAPPMAGRTSLLHPLGLLLAPLVLWAPHVLAGEGDTFRPVLQYNYARDDNLFRLADSNLPFAQGRGDSYQTLGAGFDLDWKQGRQQFLVSALASQTQFNKYTQLDYDGGNATAEWKWQLGNRLRGTLGTDYSVYQGTYLDVTGLVGNVRTQRKHYATGTWWFHSNWEAEVRYNRFSINYSDVAQIGSNYEYDDIALGLFYRGGQMERLGVEFSTQDGRYPDRTAPLATRFDRESIYLVANWLPTGKTRLKTRIGYISRNDNAAAQRDYSGLNARVDMDWSPGGKTLANLAAYRTQENSELAGADSVTTTGLKGNLLWQPLAKIILSTNLTLEQNRYNGTVLDEDINTAGVSATYQPWPGTDITLSLTKQQRRSNITTREFDATVLGLIAQVKF